VTRLGDAFLLRDLVRDGDHLAQQLRVGRGELGGVAVALLRDHQHMGGGLRVDVPDGDDPFVLEDDVSGDLAVDDPQEQVVAVAHASRLSDFCAPRSPCWAAVPQPGLGGHPVTAQRTGPRGRSPARVGLHAPCGAAGQRPEPAPTLSRRVTSAFRKSHVPIGNQSAFTAASLRPPTAHRSVSTPSAPSATAAAVEARSTVGPSRTTCAPAPASTSSSSSLTPPSGPTTRSRSPESGNSAEASGTSVDSCSTRAASARRTSSANCLVVTGSATSGTQARRACLAAWKAVLRHRAKALAPRGPSSHLATQRAARQGSTESTPASVASSTANSPRSPLISACASRTRSAGCSTCQVSATSSCKESLATDTTWHRAIPPRPSDSSNCSPGRRRRTVAACLPSGPSKVIALSAGSCGTANTGSCPATAHRFPNERNRANRPWRWPFELALIAGSGCSSPRSAASCRNSSACWSSSLVGTTTLRWTCKSPCPLTRPFERSLGNPRPLSTNSVPGWVPGSTCTSSRLPSSSSS